MKSTKIFFIFITHTLFFFSCTKTVLPTLKQAVYASRQDWIRAIILRQRSFFDPKEKTLLFDRQALEKKKFGLERHIKKYKKEKVGNTVLEQRSGRKRLYDHNILLRAVYDDQIQIAGRSLKSEFTSATFVDIGSAILFQEGAPTVQDIYDDQILRKNFYRILATDINDTSSPQTRYIEIYQKQTKKLPFPVREIPMSIIEPAQVTALLAGIVADEKAAVIFRAANSGPDLFYSKTDLEKHFNAVANATMNRPVLYLFNIFVIYKSPNENLWRIIGTIDEKVGLNHRASTWSEIKWSRRTLNQAFKAYKNHIK